MDFLKDLSKFAELGISAVALIVVAALIVYFLRHLDKNNKRMDSLLSSHKVERDTLDKRHREERDQLYNELRKDRKDNKAALQELKTVIETANRLNGV